MRVTGSSACDRLGKRQSTFWQRCAHQNRAMEARKASVEFLRRWDHAGSIATKPDARPKGEQRRGLTRAQAETEAAWKRFPDPDINDHHGTLKKHTASLPSGAASRQ